MSQSWIEPRSPGPLANLYPLGQFKFPAQSPVDHLPHPVVQSLIFFFHCFLLLLEDILFLAKGYPFAAIYISSYGRLCQAEILLHSLEQAAAGIGLHDNAHKTDYMCLNQTGDISTLKLLDKFTYIGSSVLSAEKYIDTRLTKAWTAIDKLLIIWKSDLTDKMKRSFF